METNFGLKEKVEEHCIVAIQYKKDSVLVVSKEEYEKCETWQPQFFNNGDTAFKLNRPGLFYLFSCATGHCQKIIIKVLDTAVVLPESQNSTATDMPDDGEKWCC
ncbi:hypothetical protein Gohar_011892 [Gossypium harknessii]|uniref:Phytocyanin domain-containing protein n=1 Tax=Gossypium harknessii TaxID=34285 RepID=A0A7J9GVD6_9ROSI|nr:hypothetical protein [Gossypium harknessii]